MRHVRSFDQYLNERKFAEIFNNEKGKFLALDGESKEEIKDELFNLIQTAYAEIGGHFKITKPDDVMKPDWAVWYAADVDDDPEADAAFFGKNTPYGVKFSGVAHDGTKSAKTAMLDDRAAMLKTKGFFCGCSGKLAAIFINKYECPVVDDPAIIKKVINKPIEFAGTHPDEQEMSELGLTDSYGWFKVKIEGNTGAHEEYKILVGVPNV